MTDVITCVLQELRERKETEARRGSDRKDHEDLPVSLVSI